MANWQRGVMRAMRIRNHPVVVAAVHDFTPWYRRITFEAEDFVGALEVFPTLWLRLWVPNPDRGAQHLSQRAYTLIDVDPESGTFALDFVLHEPHGPASGWASTVEVGDEREVALTPKEVVLPDGISRVVLAGDVTALPAINTWLESVDESLPVAVYLEDDHTDLADLPQSGHPRATWTWVERSGARGAALAGTIAAGEHASPGLYLWGAGEKTLVGALRTVARERLDLDKQHAFTQFYWIEGKSPA